MPVSTQNKHIGTQLLLFEEEMPIVTPYNWFEEMLSILGVEQCSGWTDDFGMALRTWLRDNQQRPVRTLSLFSGGGGLDIAFHDAGFQIVEMVELEEKYVPTLRANAVPEGLLAGSVVRCMDIRDYRPSDNLNIEFIIGGPPCQTFSAAGRRAAGVSGTTDPRGKLFEEYVRLLKQIQPIGFLFENVYGMTGAQNGEDWEEIKNAFREAGYTIHHRILDAADFGAPQHRERVFIIGVREGDYLFPYPTHGPDSIGNQPYYSASEALANADIKGATEGIGGRFGHLLKDIPPGLNYSFYTSEMGHPSPIFGWRAKFSDYLYKADPELPVRTLKAQLGAYSGPFHWENRPFTIGEFKRLQTIPDAYKMVGNRQTVIEQIGNSVPPQLGRILALSILHQVLGGELPFEMHYLPSNKELGFRKRKRQLTARYASKATEALQKLKGDVSIIPQQAERKIVRHITPDFGWSKEAVIASKTLYVEQCIEDDEWRISVYGAEHKEIDKYFVTLMPSYQDWSLPTKRVVLSADGWDSTLFTALFKALEEVMTMICGMPDLVQLSGYYQYKPRISCEMRFEAEPEAPYWHLLSRVARGEEVAKQMLLSEMANLWNTGEVEALNFLRYLRSIGYEVRNQNTNKQIKHDEYLIPYAFPTLTPRSLQLRKRL